MTTDLPVRERSLPPDAAERIRAALLVDAVDLGDRRRRTWLVPVAAALVVVALLAAAAVLWPRTSQTEVARTPTPVQLSWTPTEVVVGPPPFYEPPVPFGRGPATPTTGPTSTSDVFDTDRGPLAAAEAAAALTFCDGDAGGDGEGAEARYARRVPSGQEDMDVVILRTAAGEEWVCIPDALLVPLDPVKPSEGPNAANPVVTHSGAGGGLDQKGAVSEWTFRALPSVRRIQVRAVAHGKPQPWFEAEVHGGLAYLPVFTPGTFTWPKKATRPTGLRYELRAFDDRGHDVPVKTVKEKKR